MLLNILLNFAAITFSLLLMYAPAFTKTRIAPTASGYLHAGNVLSFALSAGFAHRAGAGILLRIDDLNRERARPDFVQDIFDTLTFLEIPWIEGPRSISDYETQYSQVHRMPLYEQALQQLIEGSAVFACTCTRTDIARNISTGSPACMCGNKRLPLHMPGTSLRLRTDDSEVMNIRTTTGNIKAALPPEMKDFVVRKKDGFPGYQLASVVDDLHFGIDFIVRGEDLWPSTIAQHYLCRKLGLPQFGNVTFHHHPLLVGADGAKLSKSAGADSVRQMHREGKSPADVFRLVGKLLQRDEQPETWLELAELVI